MKSTITIHFKKINNVPVDKTLSNNPMLIKSTKKTVDILCEQIERYFKDNKIIVETEHDLKT
jgi:hypothetical protein